MQICSEAEVHDKVTLSESASGRLKHGLQKYAPVDEDANSPDNYKNQGQTIEVNCVRKFLFRNCVLQCKSNRVNGFS